MRRNLRRSAMLVAACSQGQRCAERMPGRARAASSPAVASSASRFWRPRAPWVSAPQRARSTRTSQLGEQRNYCCQQRHIVLKLRDDARKALAKGVSCRRW